MRTPFLLFIALGLGGCSTDEFAGGDGGDASSSSDASDASDAATTADGGASDAAVDACPPTTSDCAGCAGQLCCVGAGTVKCGNTGSCTAFSLACHAPSECTNALVDAAPSVCCLELDSGIDKGCPTTIEGTHGASTCVPLAQCELTGFARMCASDNDCPNDQRCTNTTFAINGGVTVGVCE